MHQIYRVLGFLAQNNDDLQAELYKHSKRYARCNDKILYCDCTNYYFDMEEEEGTKEYGASKEYRPNPIVQMGLFMDTDGLPLAFSLLNGSANEQSSFKPLEEKILSDFNLTRFIVCTDARLSSHENRLFNGVKEQSFIVTQSLRKLQKFLRKLVLDPTDWQLDESLKRLELVLIKVMQKIVKLTKQEN